MVTVLGLESEYSVGAVNKSSDLSNEYVAGRLFRLATQTLPHLPSDSGSRIFIGNAGVLYIDMGDHFEYGTPECTNPWDLVRYVRAGDVIMSRLAIQLGADTRSTIAVGRGNVGYSDCPTTWACHESYLTRMSPSKLAESLTPFMVSRVIFAGGGGFDPFNKGIAFTLSPRTHFVSKTASTDTTRSRGIICLKDEPLSRRGFHRLHLILGDSLGSELSMWLRAGATALTACLLDSGWTPPRQITPVDPLRAMRVFATDTSMSCKIPTLTDHRIDAIEIQRAYIQGIEETDSHHFPDWAPKIIEAWTRMLDLLESGSDKVTKALDWAIKLEMYKDFCNQAGIEWDTLPAWNSLIDKLMTCYRRAGKDEPRRFDASTIFGSSSPVLETRHVESYMNKHRLDIKKFEQIQPLRQKLFDIEAQYLQTVDGVFGRLDSLNVLEHSVVTDRAAILTATHKSPLGCRSEIRGKCVEKYSGQHGVSAGWSRIVDEDNNRSICLENPLTTTSTWRRGDTNAAAPDDNIAESVISVLRRRVMRRRSEEAG